MDEEDLWLVGLMSIRLGKMLGWLEGCQVGWGDYLVGWGGCSVGCGGSWGIWEDLGACVSD